MDIGKIDQQALLSLVDGWNCVRVEGQVYFALHPREPILDHMLFDRAVCETGLTEFIREKVPDDDPRPENMIQQGSSDFLSPLPGPWVLVQQVSPGVRTRFSLDIRWGEAVPLKEALRTGRFPRGRRRR
jgi:hypothetical protein